MVMAYSPETLAILTRMGLGGSSYKIYTQEDDSKVVVFKDEGTLNKGNGVMVRYYIADGEASNSYSYRIETEYPSSNGDTPSRIVTEYVDDGNGNSILSSLSSFFGNGSQSTLINVNAKGEVIGFSKNGKSEVAGAFFEQLGSTIGGVLGGNSFGEQLGAKTIGGTFTKILGNALVSGLSSSFDGGRFFDAVSGSFSQSLENLPKTVIEDGFGNLRSGVSSLLMQEVAKAFHVKGFEGVLLTSVGTTITQQLLTNAQSIASSAFMSGNVDPSILFNGFDPVSLITNISGSVAGSLGSYLGHMVYEVHTQAGSIGASIGATIGSYLGSVLPVIGNFIGSFIGTIIGGSIGDVVGEAYFPVKAWGNAAVNVTFNSLEGFNFGGKRGGSPAFFEAIINAQDKAIDQVIADMHGKISGVKNQQGSDPKYADIENFYSKNGDISWVLATEDGAWQRPSLPSATNENLYMLLIMVQPKFCAI